MAWKIDKSKVSDTAWGDVDKGAIGKALAMAFAAGDVSKAQIREVYAFVPEDAFGKDADGKSTFAYSKGWGPHHELDGNTIVLNRGGVIGSAQALAGARSKPTLSGSDLTKAKAHIRKHYKALKMTAPASIAEALEVRKAERGLPLTLAEMVKGSLEYTQAMIDDAFREQFKQPDFRYDYHGASMWCPFYIVDTFADQVFVSELGSMDDNDLAPDEYYLVKYTRDAAPGTAGGKIVFDPIEQWEIVELAYQPQSTTPPQQPAMEGRRNGRRGERMQERLEGGRVVLLERSADGKTRTIRINGLMQADVVNGNGRRYPLGVLEAAVATWRTHLHESAGQGRLKILTGEADHPSDKGNKRPQYLETVVKWNAIEMNEGRVDVIGDLILTSKGKDVETLMEAGVLPGGSVRGYYESQSVKDGDQVIEQVGWCEFTGADLVGDPSFENVADLLESKRAMNRATTEQGEKEMDPKELAKLIGEHPEWFKGMFEGEVKALGEAQLKALDESIRKQLGLAPDADLGAALKEMAEAKRERDEAKAKAEVEAAITEATKGLPYGEAMNGLFVEAVRAETLRFAQSDKSKEAIKALVEAKRKEYDAIAAKAKLGAMGFSMSGVAPVLESETGMPEYARGAHEFYESLVRRGNVERRDLRKPKTLNEEQTVAMLERFDKINKAQLMRESRLMQETGEVSTDLNLPYSVSRAILQSVWPTLVATGIFDSGVTDQAPSRVYYETYAGESGSSAAASNDDTTMTVLDTWYDLDYKMIQPGTVVAINSSNGNAALTEGTDYLIDYFNGKILAITGGGVSAGNVIRCSSYTYDVIRLAENNAIQRGKVTLAYTTLEIMANRLADQITNEAVVFGRSQLGWDATTRTMASLVNQLRRKIDKNLMYTALNAALSVASNSGGTWTAATDPIINLISYLGVSKVKIAARFYEPTGILLSATNSDRVGNWDGFTAAGKRPDSDLQVNGYVGRIKGLPVFQSTEFSDGYGLVLNRELLMYRVYQPMALKGPFPMYSSTNLVAAEQWYAEQYDGALCPVAGKGSTVKFA